MNNNIQKVPETKIDIEDIRIRAIQTGDPAEYPGLELVASYKGVEFASVRFEVDLHDGNFQCLFWTALPALERPKQDQENTGSSEGNE